MTGDFRQGETILDELVVVDCFKGSVGIVYKLEHLVAGARIGEFCCAKTLQDKYVSSEERRAEFTDEARNWLRLGKFECIVRALDYEPDLRGKPYIFIQYADWGSLQSLVQNGFRAWETEIDCYFALRLCHTACLGLSYIHRKSNMIHGDVSLRNLLIHGREHNRQHVRSNAPPQDDDFRVPLFNKPQSGFVKVTDFGLSRVYDPATIDREDFAHDIVLFGRNVLYPIFAGLTTRQDSYRATVVRVKGRLGRAIGDLIEDCITRRLNSFDDIAARLQDLAVQYYYGISFPTPADSYREMLSGIQQLMHKEFGIVENSASLPAATADKIERKQKHYVEHGGLNRDFIGGIPQFNFEFPETIIARGDSFFRLEEYRAAVTCYKEALSLCDVTSDDDDATLKDEERERKHSIYVRLAALFGRIQNGELEARYLELAQNLQYGSGDGEAEND